MNKLLAFLLALTLLLSVGITAFAETIAGNAADVATGQQIITVNAPALTWTLEIPADLEIDFGNPNQIDMGKVQLSDISWDALPENNFIYVTMAYNRQLSSTTSSSTIAYDLLCQVHDWNNSDVEMIGSYSEPGADKRPVAYYHSSVYKRWSEMYIQISVRNWQTIVPSETYQGTITYSSQYGTWE